MTKKDPPPRGKQEADLLESLRGLSITAAHEILSGFDRLRQLRDDLQDGDVDDANESRARRERVKSMAYEIARHEVEYAERILSLSHAHADLLFEDVRRLVRRARSSTEGDARPAKVVDLRALASSGEPARASFEVRNRSSIDADVRFDLGRFHDRAGAEVDVDVTMKCDPERVPPNANATVTLSFDATAAKASLPRGVYFAELGVFLVGEIEERVARRLVRLRFED